MKVVSVTQGNKPIILAQPHGGTWLPDDILTRLNHTGKALADTDWHINRLYHGLVDDITVVESHVHRYVIDANRNPSDESLYPGQNTTGLCPVTDFDGRPIYQDNQQPDNKEIEQRRIAYFQPYHDALTLQIQRLMQVHQCVVLYDCHSIRSAAPYLFDGRLPDFNIGTYNGQSCSKKIEQAVLDICQAAKGYSQVVNGRFKGGWTTRHYGRPEQGVQAIQMELAQSSYMDEAPPWQYRTDKASRLRQHLSRIVETLVDLAGL